ncbi:MAG: redoxin domain-containing protein [Candidatus Marinimicrobia bacterium]|nr:redoxin domain-containing protein [Candidatus Neomarinimicrobiota bacterium]MBT3676443.1 redoxin domain-containing protein [Candidatus Neomarinimicrobiota bacterium]MBT3762639.1 redoxin domain-containing protein [Candidatus Neomarinimicrobiota bacterium]MBT4068471.1 redoxin domain-containing protein [Candidatus Neomarinimicrobiota bacterium]MBT4371383.1 redoxin domain-containing protein [Candidatus Neomarinimicrobiota bacterium]
MKTSIFLFTMMTFLFGKSADTLKVGDMAPDFTLLSEENKKITLKDYRGKWVIVYFFPKADTPG